MEMTASRAIEVLLEKYNAELRFGDEEADWNAYWFGADALKRQVPQKPIIKEDEVWVCPRCKAEHSHETGAAKYCNNCGQAIDWTE